MKAKPTTVCTRCRGTGRVPLTGECATTLAKLAAVGEHTGARLARIMGVNPTAMSNRLAKLAALGLATCRPYGRKKFYRVAGTAP